MKKNNLNGSMLELAMSVIVYMVYTYTHNNNTVPLHLTPEMFKKINVFSLYFSSVHESFAIYRVDNARLKLHRCNYTAPHPRCQGNLPRRRKMTDRTHLPFRKAHSFKTSTSSSRLSFF